MAEEKYEEYEYDDFQEDELNIDEINELFLKKCTSNVSTNRRRKLNSRTDY
ncbi:hypothetical protein LEAN103870_18725 [Legionella anisa]|nr:hypothetical protein Lani_0769 [Legionella anisa]